MHKTLFTPVFLALLFCFQSFGPLIAQTPCTGGMAGIYPCNNTELLAYMPLSSLGGGSANDIWGWTDPVTGNEFAILGKTNGTAFVDITDPVNPVYLGTLPRHSSNSSWRDIKVFNNHAFIVSEAGASGVQVFDLNQLTSIVSPPVAFTETSHFVLGGGGNAHNIVMNETTGYAYTVGGSCGGGPVFLNVSNPLAIVEESCYGTDGYTHDAVAFIYLGPDTEHIGKEIIIASNEDTQTIIDVTDKSAPTQISRTPYASSRYTHQGWITQDHKYLLFDDELDEAQLGVNTTTYIWDIQDLDNPVMVGTFVNTTAAIDHNMYVKGNYVYQSNYRSGLRILELTDLTTASLTEVAYFDVYPANDNANFSGSWSNYPFFPSGNIIVSSIGEGLFIVRPNIPHFFITGPDSPVEICQGDNAVFALDLSALYGFSNTVTLTETGSPAGATVNFSSSLVAPSGNSTLTISNTAALTVGNYSINVIGTATGGYHSISLGLKIASLPPATNLAAPANGTTGAPVNQPVVWTAVSEANSYEVDIALDAAFINMVENQAGLTNTLFIPSTLLPGTTYFWRVRCQNNCGNSVYSTVFSFTTDFQLPIELTDFRSEAKTSSIQLLWETASEVNAIGFFIERRTGNTEFAQIGWVDSQGNNSGNAYRFQDHEVLGGVTYYYRLQMVDRDGSSKYSPVISDKIEVFVSGLEIAPNPVKDKVQLRLSTLNSETISVTIHDLSGRIMYSKNLDLTPGFNQFPIDVENWNNGLYLLTAKMGSYSKPLKFVVIHP